MIEVLSDVDDALMEKYLSGAEISAPEIKRAIRKGTISLQFVPVLMGASFRNKGVHPLLDAIVDFPSFPPTSRPWSAIIPALWSRRPGRRRMPSRSQPWSLRS